MSKEQILQAIPHRPPFLFLDDIIRSDANGIVCTYTFKEEEFFFQGHYPGSPIVPGVIICESALQAGAVYLSNIMNQEEESNSPVSEDGNKSVSHSDSSSKVPVVVRMDNIRFKNLVRPGDTIEIEVTFKERMAGAIFMAAKITSAGKIVVRFDFSCTLTDRPAT